MYYFGFYEEVKMKQTIKIPEGKINQYRRELEEYSMDLIVGLSVKVKQIHMMSKWSSKDMSKVMGVGINAITDYERGIRDMKLTSLIWYCEMSDLDPTTLLGYTTRTQRGYGPISTSTFKDEMFQPDSLLGFYKRLQSLPHESQEEIIRFTEKYLNNI